MTTIDICLCTYKRESLLQTLRSLDKQVLPANLSIRVIIADNDAVPSARSLVNSVRGLLHIPLHYVHAPQNNISIARNACLDTATAEWIAFIDDDCIADPHWLDTLLKRAQADDLTAVFGPAIAEYTPETPDWIRRNDYHSNRPKKNSGVVQTGHTCNALLRRDDPAVRGKRFEIARGRTGGEDTAFFFSIHRDGGRFGMCDTAIVREMVEPGRLNYRWISRRMFRAGQSFGASSAGENSLKRFGTAQLALIKAGLCFLIAALTFWSEARRNYWALRGTFHAGVVANLLSLREREIYQD